MPIFLLHYTNTYTYSPVSKIVMCVPAGAIFIFPVLDQNSSMFPVYVLKGSGRVE